MQMPISMSISRFFCRAKLAKKMAIKMDTQLVRLIVKMREKPHTNIRQAREKRIALFLYEKNKQSATGRNIEIYFAIRE
ncbi:MAG: hypothetical protein HBSAPP01_15540 [Candidatus Brocadia sapporoensis]|nr:MAG: hypothetical protein HBSAPP01_15540 [Candidatus Brocadia sapporoensis]